MSAPEKIPLGMDEHVTLIERSDPGHVVSTTFGPRGPRLIVASTADWSFLVLAKLRGVQLPPNLEAAYAALPARQRGEA